MIYFKYLVFALYGLLVSSCSEEFAEITPTEKEKLFTSFELVNEDLGEFHYNGWKIHIRLRDSSQYTEKRIEELKNSLDEVEIFVPICELEKAKEYVTLELRKHHVSGEFFGMNIMLMSYKTEVIIHEIGHVRFQNNYRFSDGYSATNSIDLYKKNKHLWKGTYAGESYNEFWAEIFRYYLLQPEWLKEKDIDSWELVDKVLNQKCKK